MIGMEGLRYIHLSDELVSEVARRITDKVADVTIVNGIFFILFRTINVTTALSHSGTEFLVTLSQPYPKPDLTNYFEY